MSPSSRAVGALLVLALLAAVASPWVAAIGGAILVSGLIVDLVRLREQVEVSVTMPHQLVRGTAAEFLVELQTSTPAAQIRQAAPAGVDIVPAVARGELRGLVTPRQRGIVRFPPLAVRITGPCGLLQRTSLHPGAGVVTVLPDLPAATRLAEATRRASLGLAGARRGALGLGTEFESVREYVANDDIRRVNWSATARTGHPMTNQFRQDEDRQVICVVDCGRLMGAPIAGATRLDLAVDAALAVSVVADSLGDRCGLLAFDAAVRAEVAPRRMGAREVLRAIGGLEVRYVESRFDLACGDLAHRRRSLLVLFTDLFDEAAGSLLKEALATLVRRHAVVIAGCLDPDVMRAATATPTTSRDGYAALVAFSMLEQQRALRASLRRGGAEVVTATPTQLSGACVAAYLRLKARNRL